MSSQSKRMLKDYVPAPALGTLAFLVGIAVAFGFVFLTGVMFTWLIEPISNTRWYLLPPTIGILVMLYILYRHTVQESVQGLELMLAFASAVTLWLFLLIIDYENKGDGAFHRSPDGFIANIADAFLALAVILFYLHLELTSNDRPNLIRAILILGSAAPLAALVILRPFQNTIERITEFNDLIAGYTAAFSISLFFMAIFGIYVYYQIFRESDTLTAEFASFVNYVGATVLLISFFLAPFGDSLGLLGYELRIYNTWMFTFGIMLFLLVYIVLPTYAYSFPFNIYEMFIIDESGTAYFHGLIEIPKGVEKLPDASLKSPAIIAIASLVSELSGAQGELRAINLSDRTIMVKSHRSIVGIVLSDRTSYFLRRGFDKFVRDFYSKYQEEIEQYSGNIAVFKDAEELLVSIFPFVQLIE